MKKSLLLLAICIAFISQSNATIRYVNASASGSGTGADWTNAYTTLQAALTAATSGDEIWVAAGTYTATASASFAMKNNVKVYGGFTTSMTLLTDRIAGANVTTLQGNLKSVISCDATITSATIIDGFTITGGTGTGATGIASGGGISLVDASPALNDLIVTANSAANGAGINMSGASAPVITNTTISSNAASTAGGGIAIAGTSAATITGVTILSNSVAATATPLSSDITHGGAGIYVTGTGNQTFTNVVFQSNTASLGQGGGLLAAVASGVTGTINLTNTVFYGNTAAYGGGIYALMPIINVTNSIFTANNSTANSPYGAGAFSINTFGASSLAKILNCTFYNNLSGGASANPDIRYLNGKSTNLITNTVFYTNGETATTPLIGLNSTTSPTLTNSYLPYYNGFTASVTNKVGASNATALQNPFYGSSTMTLADMKGPDGLWMTSDDGLHLSGSSSPGLLAMDNGNNTGVSSKDITNVNPRIQNTTVDMGAYEGVYSLFALPVKLISFSGALQNGTAQLQWRTGVEDAFNHFELEKSVDGINYAKLSNIAAKGSDSRYTYAAAQAEATAYYRLKIIDNDGRFVYSNILRLAQSVTASLQLYPNPAKDYIAITTSEDGTMNMYDVTGKLEKTQQLRKGTNTVDISTLSSGFHLCEVNGKKVQFVIQ